METSPSTVLESAKEAVTKKFANFLTVSRKDSLGSRSSNSSNYSPACGSHGYIPQLQTSHLVFTSSESTDSRVQRAPKLLDLSSCGPKPKIEKTQSLQERSSRRRFVNSKSHASSVDSPTWNDNEGPKSLSFWKVPRILFYVSALTGFSRYLLSE